MPFLRLGYSILALHSGSIISKQLFLNIKQHAYMLSAISKFIFPLREMACHTRLIGLKAR